MRRSAVGKLPVHRRRGPGPPDNVADCALRGGALPAPRCLAPFAHRFASPILTQFMPEPSVASTASSRLAARPNLLLCAWGVFLLALAVLAWPESLVQRMLPGTALVTGLAMAYGVVFSAWLVKRVIRIEQHAYRSEQQLHSTLADAEAAFDRHVEARIQALRLEIDVRKALETRLQHTLDALYRQLADQRDFTAMVSHEFRTPLAIIDTATQSLQMLDCGKDPHGAPRLERIRRAVKRLSVLIRGLQTADRLERENAALVFEPVDLAAIARKLVTSQPPEASVMVDVRAEPVVAGDAGLLEVALANLVGNAVKYAGRYGRIIVIIDQIDGQARIDVVDDGPGIDDADLDRVFERFYRGAGVRDLPGVGLGLFLTRRICETHGGKVTGRNRPGGGCVFTMIMPLAAHDLAGGPATAP